jgi:hypothetical protein
VVIVSVAVAELAPTLLVIVAVVLLFTVDVVIVNLPVLAPEATATEEATFALAEEELRVTVTCLVAEFGIAFSVTVPAELVPPFTEDGETLRPVMVNGFTVRLALWEVPL